MFEKIRLVGPWFEKFFDRPPVENKPEKLTPEQIEQEKREFEANRLNRRRSEIKHMVESCLEVGCMKRDNLKPHYIAKVYLLEDTHKVVADCAFCGIANYYHSLEPIETLESWLNEEFNK
jgi:hypothetical protein